MGRQVPGAGMSDSAPPTLVLDSVRVDGCGYVGYATNPAVPAAQILRQVLCDPPTTECPNPLPPLAEGDLLAFSSAGAYSFVMASTYNSRPLAPEILVRGDRSAIVRPRMDYETMIGQDRLPDWLAGEENNPRQRKAGQARGAA